MLLGVANHLQYEIRTEEKFVLQATNTQGLRTIKASYIPPTCHGDMK